MSEHFPAEAFPLCDYLREEIAAQGYEVGDFSKRVAMPEERIMHLLEEPDARMLMHEAEQIARVLDVNPEVLLRLQVAYSRWLIAKARGQT